MPLRRGRFLPMALGRRGLDEPRSVLGVSPRRCRLRPSQDDAAARDSRGRDGGPWSHARMAKRMLIDAAHPEETRVVVLSGHRLDEFDFETSTKKQIKGNIYLAKVTRVEPSLQAAFVEYGGNRHGFLAFNEI